MSDFLWVNDESQIYTKEYGTQEINDFGLTLGKSPGARFTMDAIDESLTLKVVRNEDVDDEWLRNSSFWGVEPKGDSNDLLAIYMFKNGEFLFVHDQREIEDWGFWLLGISYWNFVDNDFTSKGFAPVLLNVYNDARVVSLVGGFFTGKKSFILLSDRAYFRTENIGTGITGGIIIQDNAYARFNTGEFFAVNATIDNSSKTTHDEYSLIIDNVDREQHEQPWSTFFFDSQMYLSKDSSTKIKGGKFILGGNTEISAAFNAKLIVDIERLEVMKYNGGCFSIGYGSPSITFENANNIFLNEETIAFPLPSGIFKFEGIDKNEYDGTFIFKNASVFVKKYLYVNELFRVGDVMITESNANDYLKDELLPDGTLRISLI